MGGCAEPRRARGGAPHTAQAQRTHTRELRHRHRTLDSTEHTRGDGNHGACRCRDSLSDTRASRTQKKAYNSET